MAHERLPRAREDGAQRGTLRRPYVDAQAGDAARESRAHHRGARRDARHGRHDHGRGRCARPRDRPRVRAGQLRRHRRSDRAREDGGAVRRLLRDAHEGRRPGPARLGQRCHPHRPRGRRARAHQSPQGHRRGPVRLDGEVDRAHRCRHCRRSARGARSLPLHGVQHLCRPDVSRLGARRWQGGVCRPRGRPGDARAPGAGHAADLPAAGRRHAGQHSVPRRGLRPVAHGAHAAGLP